MPALPKYAAVPREVFGAGAVPVEESVAVEAVEAQGVAGEKLEEAEDKDKEDDDVDDDSGSGDDEEEDFPILPIAKTLLVKQGKKGKRGIWFMTVMTRASPAHQ